VGQNLYLMVKKVNDLTNLCKINRACGVKFPQLGELVFVPAPEWNLNYIVWGYKIKLLYIEETNNKKNVLNTKYIHQSNQNFKI